MDIRIDLSKKSVSLGVNHCAFTLLEASESRNRISAGEAVLRGRAENERQCMHKKLRH